MSEELESLVVRLTGENSDYRRMIDQSVGEIQRLEQAVDQAMAHNAQATAEAEASIREYEAQVAEAAATTRAAATPTEQYDEALEDLNRQHRQGMISAETHERSVRNLNAEFGRGAHRAASFGKSMQSFGAGMMGVGSGLMLGVTTPIVGMAVAMAKAGSDAEESHSKFLQVFKDVGKSANDMADELDKAYGMSRGEAETMLSDTGDLLSGFGFTGAAALDMSGQIQKLAVDLASFTNVEGGATHASQALTKALLGEREMAKMLGIAITEEEIKTQMATNKKKGLTFATDKQAKAQATLDIMYRQSANALGDYSRTSDGLANTTRELMGDIKDLAANFGKLLLPMFKKIVSVVRGAIAWFRGLSDNVKRMILIAGGIAAALGPVIFIIGGVVAAIGTVIAAIAGFVAIGAPAIAAAAAIAVKIGLIVTAAAAVGAAIAAAAYYLIGPEGLAAGWDYIVTTTKKWAMLTIGFLANFKHNIGVLMKWLPKNWDNLFKDMGRIFITFVKNGIKNSGVMLKALFRIWTVLQGFMSNLFRQIFTVDFLNFVVSGIKKVTGIYMDFAKWAWEALKSIFSGDSASIEDFGAQMASDFQKGANTQNLLTTIGDVAKEEMANLHSPMEGFESSIEDAPEFSYDMGQKAGEQLAEGFKDAVKDEGAGASAVDPLVAKLTEDITKLEDGLKEQIATFGMAGAAVEIYKLQQRGATEEQLKAAKALDAELKLLEKEAKLKQKAEALTKKHLSPLQKFTEGQNELNEMLEKGLIDVHTHTEAMAELQKGFDKEMKVKITVEGVDAALAGTAEAEARLREFRANAMGALDVAVPNAPVQVAGGGIAQAVAADAAVNDPGGQANSNPLQVVELLRVMADGITTIVDEDTMTLIQADLDG